ncbi:structural protein, partial [Photorhabdus bodei]
MSRGIRNNNPGNIRWGDDWQGLIPASQRTDKSFCQFVSP